MSNNQRHQTQWSAQFLTAAKLVSHGYEVGFTMGNNTPLADLFVSRPDRGEAFLIDVKGQIFSSFWLIRQRDIVPNLFYVLVGVNKKDIMRSRFFIAGHKKIHEMMSDYKNSGVKPDDRFHGFNWGAAMDIENAWHCLPGWQE